MCNTGDGALVGVFFGDGRNDHDGERARHICQHCPVTAECLTDALDQPANPPGVWGGLTHDERAALRKEHRDDRPATQPR